MNKTSGPTRTSICSFRWNKNKQDYTIKKTINLTLRKSCQLVQEFSERFNSVLRLLTKKDLNCLREFIIRQKKHKHHDLLFWNFQSKTRPF